MNTAFKYMSYLGLEYFKDPTFRISLVEELNDPFECKLSADIERVADEMIKSIDIEIDEKTRSGIEKNITEALSGTGVISFSETHRNLLMWAHYSDDHKGICIEVDTDWSKSKARLENTLSNDLHSFKRVKYDTRRVDFNDMTEINIYNYQRITIELCMKHLTLKSDEWMYEKEHRNIMSFIEADYIKVKPRVVVPQNIRDKIKKITKKDKVKIGENGYITTDYSNLAFFEYTFYSKLFMYLNKIPTDKIRKIYLGARCESKDELIEEFKNPAHPLHHVEIHQCTISNSRFELNTERVY